MAGLLSGLEQFGLSNLESMDLYEKPKKEEEGEEGAQAAVHTVQEQDFLLTSLLPVLSVTRSSRREPLRSVRRNWREAIWIFGRSTSRLIS